jgi:ParB family transcriptional regulator, chromosome partitioning protein
MSGADGSGQKRPRDLREGLANLYAGATTLPEPAVPTPVASARGIGTLGGAPAVFVEQQKRSLISENAELRSELDRLREGGGADMLLDPAQVRDRFPPDRTHHAFRDEAFQALKASILNHGQDQPILVRPHVTEPEAYEIAYGRRRREACRELGVKVKARVKPLTDSELLRAMVRENEEREVLSLYERAAFVRRLAESERLSVRKLAAMLEISPGYVSRLTRLPVLPPALETLIGDPRPLSVRTLEDLAGILAEEGALDRILDRWGGIVPGSTPERRARQAITLSATASVGSLSEQRHQVRVLKTLGGRMLGRLRRRGDSTPIVELATELSEAEVEAVAKAIEGALEDGQGRGV